MEVISIRRIAMAALDAVQAGQDKAAGCPWPGDSEAAHLFRMFHTTYLDLRRASAAKAAAEQPTRPTHHRHASTA